MTDDRDALYLAHIAETIGLLNEAGAYSQSRLESDRVLRDATLYRLQTLSESAAALSDEVKTRHPEIPWPAISGFRNQLVHAYLTVRLERVVEVLTRSIEPLARSVEAELVKRERDRNRSRGRELDL